MQCYNVECINLETNEPCSKGVLTYSAEHAMEVAVKSFLEGQHLKVKAIKAVEVDAI